MEVVEAARRLDAVIGVCGYRFLPKEIAFGPGRMVRHRNSSEAAAYDSSVAMFFSDIRCNPAACL
jgi:hypothetical protein